MGLYVKLIPDTMCIMIGDSGYKMKKAKFHVTSIIACTFISVLYLTRRLRQEIKDAKMLSASAVSKIAGVSILGCNLNCSSST
mmetsp:Transcript_17287/g.24204  ORF Transcript_17287/g.24204 Transcript_17287/m.24204 type:complete len:83 (+) Transcript_17287:178-426(+)